MNTIQSEWENFRDEVMPEDAANEQIRDMEAAFYAGVLTMLNLNVIIADEKDEDTAVEILEGYHIEARQFFIDRENEHKENESDTGICMMCYKEKSESDSCDRKDCISK